MLYMKEEKMEADKMKAEYMTSLSGNRMVPKTHGRIAFRGAIDTLEAEVIEAQVLASELGEKANFAESETNAGVCCGICRDMCRDICRELGEILDYLRAIMAAEVKETPLPPPFLFGMDAEEIHRLSRRPVDQDKGGDFGAALPAYTQGPLAARLNTLRAKVRETELLAVRVFGPEENPYGIAAGETGITPREDIILALNRLSSALWWLHCKYKSSKLYCLT